MPEHTYDRRLAYQMRHRRASKCAYCPEPICPGSIRFCVFHRDKARDDQKARRHKKKAAKLAAKEQR